METNEPRERSSGPKSVSGSAEGSRQSRGYRRFQHGKIQRRMFVVVSLAEGEELGSNGLLICIDRSPHAEDAPIQLLEITKKFVEQRVTSGLF